MILRQEKAPNVRGYGLVEELKIVIIAMIEYKLSNGVNNQLFRVIMCRRGVDNQGDDPSE